jgi:transcriptional regulator with XRE-family HTH domain
MLIGNAIKEIRKQKKIQQQELSELCKLSQTYLSQIENNKKQPNLTTLEIIGEKLGIPIPVILFLSLTDNDVPENKRELFRFMSPIVEKFINEIFIESN